jgi:hypothetical protein
VVRLDVYVEVDAVVPTVDWEGFVRMLRADRKEEEDGCRVWRVCVWVCPLLGLFSWFVAFPFSFSFSVRSPLPRFN